MKIISMIVLAVFLGKGCSQETQNDLENTVLEYTANTRGFYEKITIQNKMVYISTIRNEKGLGEGKAISDTDWKELVSLFDKVDLEQLATYKDPTQKRFYDGAAIAQLIVKHQEKEYQTITFDHGDPPVEIAEFITKITSFESSRE